MLTSRRLASLAVQRLRLQDDPSFVGRPPRHGADDDGPMGAAASALQGKVDAKLMEGTRLITVSLDDTDPDRAQRLLGGLLETFAQRNLAEPASAASSNDRLHEQLTNLEQDLADNEQTLHTFKKERNILPGSFADQAGMLGEELAQLTRSLTEARAQREKLAARLGELKLDVDDFHALFAGRPSASSPRLTQLRNELVDARRDRDSLLASGRGPDHPDVLAAESRVTSTRRALLDEARSLQIGAKRDLDVVTRHIDGLAGLYEVAKHRALDLNQLEIEYQRFERLKNDSERLYSRLLERSEQADLGGQARVHNIRVLDAPLPGLRVRPNVPGTVAVGLLLGLAVGLVVAFGRLLLGRTLDSREDLEEGLGLPFFGYLPDASREACHAPKERGPDAEVTGTVAPSTS
jgi:uncharacterized protein involved in exopolysaccharide biosynthesis